MVKFGRHVDFFVANELDAARQLYVIPYKDIQRKTCLDPPKPAAQPEDEEAPPEESPPSPFISPSSSPKPKPGQNFASGLSALFNPPSNNNNIDEIFLPEIDAVNSKETGSKGVRPAQTAVTLNNATGAELAKAIRSLRVGRRQQPDPIPVIPDDYGYDDPCNSEDEVDEQANAHFFANRFETEWRIALKRASADFERAMGLFWNEVFQGIIQHMEEDGEDDAIRGALPDAALQLYVSVAPADEAQNLFNFLKDIHATALINAEALRKLTKKFDKHHIDKIRTIDNNVYSLSAKLLPEVYASNFTVGLASVDAGLTLLRAFLNIDEEESLGDGEELRANKHLKKLTTMDIDSRELAVLSGGYFGNKKDLDAELVKKRKEELEWLRNMVEEIDPVYVPSLVGHRGFHNVHDRSDVRPLENSLMAYEAAWTSGICLCECDIALTKDERIILAHDENFARLGMDPTSPLCNRTVRDLTFKELMSCPLKSGARPPLLFDVLRSAAAIGDHAKMIVEIKAGNTEAGPALARMFLRHPNLMDHVAVVMSFDAFIMHNFRREMAYVYEQLHTNQVPPPPPVEEKKEMFSPPLSSSPNLRPSYLGHNRVASHARLPSMLGGEIIIDIGVEGQDGNAPIMPATSTFTIGQNLSSSPNLRPSYLGHNRVPSQNRFPMMDTKADYGVGLSLTNLAEVDRAASTFLPTQKSSDFYHPDEVKEEHEEPDPSIMSVRSFPKLLLITVADEPKKDYELHVDMTNPEKITELEGWLRGRDGGSLDGVYMQYQKPMLGIEGQNVMRNLASRYNVGIWGANPIPDDWNTFHSLVTECHVSYVNSSLPRHFRRKMKRSMSANTLAMNAILVGKDGNII